MTRRHDDPPGGRGHLSSGPPKKKPHGKSRRRLRLFDRSITKKLGLPPGSVVPVGSHHEFKPFVTLLQYAGGEHHEYMPAEPADLAPLIKPDFINWINVEGVHDVSMVQSVSQLLGLHPLTQEDIVNTNQRPQFESYDQYYFFALKMLYLGPDHRLLTEHVSLILKGNTVATFQETPGDVFGRIRERIRSKSGKVCSQPADYLLYLLLDSIVDGYYQVIDHLAERLDGIEDQMRCGPRDQQLAEMFTLRRETLFLRKSIMPVRDLLAKVDVDGSVFQEYTKTYLKDLSDHMQQVADGLNLAMEMTSVLIETYHSMQNQRLNAVMKTLTMISTLFLPLNFIAGVYGMNFKHMPELELHYGYPMALGLMVIVGLGMLAYFVYRGWLLEGRKRLDFLTSDEDRRDLQALSKP